MACAFPDLLGQDHPKYKKVRDIYQGKIGFMQLCQNKLNKELVVIQFIHRGSIINEQIQNSIISHRKLNHPHVIKFIEAFLLNLHLAVATEFAAGGELNDYVLKQKNLSEDEARNYFQQLIEGVDYCHKMGVKNKELKMENILLDGAKQPLLKLCNSKYDMIRCTPKSKDVLPKLVAPEVMANQNYDGEVADVWSCGAMLYIMLFGKHPFERPEDTPSNQIQRLMSRITSADYEIPKNFPLTIDCHDILNKMFEIEPQKRIKLSQIYQHPWFKQQENIDVNIVGNSNSGNVVNQGVRRSVQSEVELQQILNSAKKFEGESLKHDLSLSLSDVVDDSMEEFRSDQFEDDEKFLGSCLTKLER